MDAGALLLTKTPSSPSDGRCSPGGRRAVGAGAPK
jgi:hypothetical protein